MTSIGFSFPAEINYGAGWREALLSAKSSVPLFPLYQVKTRLVRLREKCYHNNSTGKRATTCTHFCDRLSKLGVNVLGIGDVPYDSLNDQLKAALTEYYYVQSLEDYEQVYHAVAYFVYHYGRADWLESLNEYWLPSISSRTLLPAGRLPRRWATP